MLFHPHSTPRFLIFALVLFPKGFGLEFVPVPFQVFESAVMISHVLLGWGIQGRLTQWPALVLAPPW